MVCVMGIFWQDVEVKLLKELYIVSGLSITELFPIFNEVYCRSFDGVWLKIKRLKLKHTKDQTTKIKSRLNYGDKNGMFGKISPLKGLTKNNSELIRLRSKKISITKLKMSKEGLLPNLSGVNNPMFGKKPWNVGLNTHNNETIKKAGEKVSKTQKKLWLNKTSEEKQMIINRLNDSMIQSKGRTKIEIKMEDLLKKLNVEYLVNYRIKNFLVDFYIPTYNLVIECDGDYWHANPDFVKGKELTKSQIKNIDRDHRKNEMLFQEGIKLLRFWECEINNDFKFIENKLMWLKPTMEQ
jgi:G:T-mismatch repair DNA endonuclease (very short patch repair protein)